MDLNETKPFIIWTLQRTGGTNLARRLFERSGLFERARTASVADTSIPWLEAIDDQWKLHEPFNSGMEGRAFGKVSEDWNATHNSETLDAALSQICALRLPIKHCVEMVPWKVNEALAKASCKEGYEHLFLYRKSSLIRLLSLRYARLSGVWGAHIKSQTGLNENLFSEPLPVDEMINHERYCINSLTRAWDILKGNNAMALAYEDIYQAEDVPSVVRRILLVLARLGLSTEQRVDKRFVLEIITKGNQGTSEQYNSFLGIEDLEAKLKDLQPFSPDIVSPAVEIVPHWKNSDKIDYATIDVFPLKVELKRSIVLGGVVVLKEPILEQGSLYLSVKGEQRSIQWGINSSGIAKRFPESPNSANARFKIGKVILEPGADINIHLDDGHGNQTKVFSFRCSSPTDQFPRSG
jgi:hypothetical protein